MAARTKPVLLPFVPRVPLCDRLWVEHIDSINGPVTLIVRTYKNPDRCTVLRVPAYVPDEECARYQIESERGGAR